MSGENDKPRVRKKQLSAAEQCLRAIKPIPPKYRFLICWDGKRKILRFGCGHGENAVFVCSDRKLEKTEWTDDSAAKLNPGCADRFISGGSRVNGKELLSRCQVVLRSYTHVQDERIYSLLAVWSIATYVYPLFSQFGYLFLHSKFPRSGKTRVEEILSHVCLEADRPVECSHRSYDPRHSCRGSYARARHF